MLKRDSIIVVALASHGQGVSGGDRIWIEFVKRWRSYLDTKVWVWREGLAMASRLSLARNKNLTFELVRVPVFVGRIFILTYLARIFLGMVKALNAKIDKPANTIIYSASEFWMDALPSIIIKLRYPKTCLICSWFQTAPNPFYGYSEIPRRKGYHSSALLYYLSQLPVKPLINRYADHILVNNQNEKKQFLNTSAKVSVVLGAVDLEKIDQYRKLHPTVKDEFAAVFQGRFHPQKGVVELVEIWSKVVKVLPKAKLVMIGDGQLMDKVDQKIKELDLVGNVILTGYLFDGADKYKIFNTSKLVVHPAFYDSGGMAAAEAIAFSIPGIGFDLESYKSYYPQGMIKVPSGNLEKFALEIVRLLKDEKKRVSIGREGRQMIERAWSWDKRAGEILSIITK